MKFKMFYLAFLSFVISLNIFAQPGNWRKIDPGFSDNIYGITSHDYNNFPFVNVQWAAGDNGVLRRTSDGWKPFNL